MQEQSFYGYALVTALILLGFMVVCLPRPRGIAFANEEEERNTSSVCNPPKILKEESEK